MSSGLTAPAGFQTRWSLVLKLASISDNAAEEAFSEKNLRWISQHREPALT
jgi:hypothetical protein